MLITPIKTRVFAEGENLTDFVVEHIEKIPESCILVVTSKIVALTEKATKIPSEIEKDQLIISESEWAQKTKYCWLTLKDGLIMANAGIDESNADGKYILLPKNSYQSAKKLRAELLKKFNLKNLGIIITDSKTIPMRKGVVGMALGYSGFKGLKDYIGTKDIFGREFHFSRTNLPDSLAASAVVTMGEGSEMQPLALIQNFSVYFCENSNEDEIKIEPADDMYFPLIKKS